MGSAESLINTSESRTITAKGSVVYGCLAFVQQIDMGDEWLVLKRELDEETGEPCWIPFESCSLAFAIRSKARFGRAVSALLVDDPYEIAALLADGENASRRQRQGRFIS